MYQHNFFEKTAKKFPNAIAVDDHGKKLAISNWIFLQIRLPT